MPGSVIESPGRPRLVALVSDFGPAGPYVGQMEAVLAVSGVDIPVVNLMSDGPVFNPRAGAYLLAALAEQMPDGTLFLAVIDPGVGGERKPLTVNTGRQWFVGPDNGLFSQVLRRAGAIKVWTIDWRPRQMSNSFHGRDLFAPVAAGICNGTLPAGTPIPVDDTAGRDWPDDLMEIIYIDHFGNAFSGMRGALLGADRVIEVHGSRIAYGRTFSELPPGAPFWYRNSCGLVEIAVNQGRADRHLGLAIGDRLQITG
jgi:S-adenosylmethionine hydrolase